MIEVRMSCPPIFTTNYGRVIQLLLEGITSLNIKFNECSSADLRNSIKTDLAILEEFLKVKALSRQHVTEKEYQSIKIYVDDMLNYYC